MHCFIKNKAGLQNVSRPVEKVPLLRGLGGGSKLQRLSKQRDRQTDKTGNR